MNTQNLSNLKTQIVANFGTESSQTFEVARLGRLLAEAESVLVDAKALAEASATGKNEAERKAQAALVTFEQRKAVEVAEANLAEAAARLRVAQLERSMLSKLLTLEVTLVNHEPEPEAEKTLADYIKDGEEMRTQANPFDGETDEPEAEEPSLYSGNYSEE